jgi:hypothetical protein
MLFALVCGLSMIIIFSGCGGTEKMAVMSPEPIPQQVTPKPLTRWLQTTYPAIATSDPVNFFNEFEINIIAKVPRKVLMFQDGNTYEVDSSTTIEMTIYKLTPGILKKVKKENGYPVLMEISFDESNPDYTMSFYSQKDRSFCFSAKVQITFEGKKYPATATIKGKPDGLNHLLSNFEGLDHTNKTQNSATGVSVQGTKIVKTD